LISSFSGRHRVEVSTFLIAHNNQTQPSYASAQILFESWSSHEPELWYYVRCFCYFNPYFANTPMTKLTREHRTQFRYLGVEPG
jgi:hypothetical protein